MDELKQIQTGFKNESDSFVAAIATRKEILDGYVKTLALVQKKTDDLIIAHKTEIVSLLNEKETLEKEIVDNKASHQNALELIKKSVNDKASELAHIEKKIEELNAKEISLNKNINILMTEYREVETRINALRVNNSIGERRAKDLLEQEKKLVDSIAKKSEEDVKLSAEIESKQTQATRLSNDVAILEARKK